MRRLERDAALAELERRRGLASSATPSCAMCALVQAAAEPELRVLQRYGITVTLDAFAAGAGHLLLVLDEHAESIAELPWERWSALHRLAWEGSRALQAVLTPKRVYVASLGSSAELPMSFAHLHLHVIPVTATDERARPAAVFSWSSGVWMYEPGEGAALAEQLRSRWPEPLPPFGGAPADLHRSEP